MSSGKRSLTALLLLALTALLVVYGVDTLRLAGDRDKKIAVVLKTTDIRSEYWRTVREGMELAAKELDVDIEITGPLSDTDADGQIRMIGEALAKKPDAFVLGATDPLRLEDAVRDVKRSGAKLILIDADVPGGQPASLVATDHAAAGRIAGKSMVSPLEKATFQVAVLGDRTRTPAQHERLRGLEEAFAETPVVDYVGMHEFGGQEDDAYMRTGMLLDQFPDLRGIVGLNEQATVGAAKAIKERGLSGRVKLVSFDSSIYEIKLLEEGTLQATVVQKPFNMGYLAIESAARALRGVKLDPRLNIEAHVITKDNLYTQGNQELLFPLVD